MVVGERREGDTVILTVQCPIDGFTSREVEQELLRRVEEGANRLIIDLGPVTYISSVGLGALILLHKRVQQANGRVFFCSLQEPVLEVFEISGVSRLLQLKADCAEALASMDAP
jgi:stage II sporulation protein AA (anti-sigma F factor antagonist)